MSTLSAHYDTPVSTTGQGLRIGVFDSGVGGLSVLRAIREVMPQADLVYVADSANAPYGERSDAFIQERSREISHFLKNQDVNGIVVACNTATAVAVQELRQNLPQLPIIGVEPGIKPGIAQSRSKRVGVLATPGTLASQKFKSLVARHGGDADLFLQPCPGLAKAIEAGDLNRPELLDLVDHFCAPLKAAKVDTVVLGCTHYPFIAQQLRAALGPNVELLDTARAVARHTATLLGSLHDAKNPVRATHGSVELWTTGSPEHLQRVAQSWLGWPLAARVMPHSLPAK